MKNFIGKILIGLSIVIAYVNLQSLPENILMNVE